MSHMRRKQNAAGFTLIEVLVVVAIIALLISILLPSLRAAREEAKAVVCQSSVKQILLGTHMYQADFLGSLPITAWSENDWYVLKKDLWFYKLGGRYLRDPKIWVCPADPYGSRFDHQAMLGDDPHSDATVPSCGYGMNYLFRHFGGPEGFNVEKYAPKRPMNVILLAEVGPDKGLQKTPLYANGGLGEAWRDGGRLVWDDGSRAWYSGPTWLTNRHMGSITMASLGGSVQRVRTTKQLRTRPLGEYADCKLGDCYFCNYHPKGSADRVHYSFASDGLYWWRGKPPQY